MRPLLLNRGAEHQPTDIIQQDVRQLHGAGNRRADNILAFLCVPRVPLDINGTKRTVRHTREYDPRHGVTPLPR